MKCFSNLKRSVARLIFFPAIAGLISILLAAGCTKKTEVVRYVFPPSAVGLISPVADTTIMDSNPAFVWHKLGDLVQYHLQVAKTSDFISPSIDTPTGDTSYTILTSLGDNTYYWRVRAQDLNGAWGDWSDAEIRILYISTYVNYFELVSQTYTTGVPQDVYVRHDTAYVADGQADLSIYDVRDPANPILYRNIDTGDDDFAKGVYVAPNSFAPDSFPYAFVADMDGKIQALNVKDTTAFYNLSFGTDQNLEDVAGIIRGTAPDDTLWILAVSSGFNRRKLSFYKILFEPTPNPYSYFFQMDMPADAMGICSEGDFAYIACGSSGLQIVSIRDIYAPILISSLPLSEGLALSVDVKDSIAYVASDRAGLYIINLGQDRSNPEIIRNINTLGRTKDVQIVGNYAYIADANYGLRAIDISDPLALRIVATYQTNYAYGLWADSNYIYLCDRDLGLLIFANHSQR
jgi:hypothetical protein